MLVITVYRMMQPLGFEGSAVKIYRLTFGKAFIVAGVFYSVSIEETHAY